MSNYLISIIIPTKNRSKELKRAIQSVFAQTYQNFEILVVDDHSEENILAEVQSFQDARVKYFKSDKLPSNANVCRNIGLLNANGIYIAMLDSDDEWIENHLECKIDHIERKQLDGVFGSLIIDNGIQLIDNVSRPLKSSEKMINYILSDGVVQTSTFVFKTNCREKVMWDETLFRHQDWDFIVRLAKEYKITPTYDLTCIVHWKLGERRQEHFDSIMKFIEQNRNEITKINYFNYHLFYYKIVRDRIDVDDKYKQHYKNEMLRYFDVISYDEFMGIFSNGKNVISRILLRIEYIFRILFL